MDHRANYGWDAPGIMLGFLGAGFGLVGLSLVLIGWHAFAFAMPLGAVAFVAGIVPLGLGLAMLQYGLAGKMRTRDAMLDLVDWRGDEQVLDIGTGAGLLLAGAAQRLNQGGHALGIDIWSAKDLSSNSALATRRNLVIEGVADRADVLTADAARLDFADGAFDVVLSLLCLHNIEPESGRDAACREIARVLKPGGRVVIGDYLPTHGYARILHEAGLEIRQSRPAFAVARSLMWLLVADKPKGLGGVDTFRSATAGGVAL